MTTKGNLRKGKEMNMLKVTIDLCHMLMKIMETERKLYNIQLKNGLGKMQKIHSCVTLYFNVSMLNNSEQYYQRILHPYMPWRNMNELVSNNHSYVSKK